MQQSDLFFYGVLYTQHHRYLQGEGKKGKKKETLKIMEGNKSASLIVNPRMCEGRGDMQRYQNEYYRFLIIITLKNKSLYSFWLRTSDLK